MIKTKNITFIEFIEKEFDALICLNADLPEYEFFSKFRGNNILAADGAALKLLEMGITPNKVIGDMDSFDKGSKDDRIPDESIIHIPDQNTNDFEKILVYTINNAYSDILIVGFHGGIVEHTLNNWSVMMRYADLLNLTVFDKGRYGLPLSKSIAMNTNIDEIVSIIPQSKAKLTTHNLKWKLEKETLKLGKREGARNRAVADEIVIEIHKGKIFLFFDSRYPLAPKYILKK